MEQPAAEEPTGPPKVRNARMADWITAIWPILLVLGSMVFYFGLVQSNLHNLENDLRKLDEKFVKQEGTYNTQLATLNNALTTVRVEQAKTQATLEILSDTQKELKRAMDLIVENQIRAQPRQRDGGR